MMAILKRSSVWLISLTLFAAASPLLGKDTEEKLVQDLASPKQDKVIDALEKFEKSPPADPNSFIAMKKLLTDLRLPVRKKAARVLGNLHAEMNDEDIKAIVMLLKSPDPSDITCGLKSLRGLKAPQAVPDIVPILKSPNTHLMRDACRTLAVLGNKDLIPSIEPLLSHPESAVRKDAQDAIDKLRSKS
jgi:HEAT repeat protein